MSHVTTQGVCGPCLRLWSRAGNYSVSSAPSARISSWLTWKQGKQHQCTSFHQMPVYVLGPMVVPSPISLEGRFWSSMMSSLSPIGSTQACLYPFGLCYLPIPKNYLILTNPPSSEITAISALNGHKVWPRLCEVPGQPRDLLHVPQHDVILVSDAQHPRLLVVNATDGSLLPTIDLLGGQRMHTMCWCNGLLGTLQWIPKTHQWTLAYYKLK